MLHNVIAGAAGTPDELSVAQVRARFVERFTMGAPFSGGEVQGPAIGDVTEKVSWVEKFVRVGGAAAAEHNRWTSQHAMHPLPNTAVRT